MAKAEKMTAYFANTSRRADEQAKINAAAEREAIRQEAAKLVNWLHR